MWQLVSLFGRNSSRLGDFVGHFHNHETVRRSGPNTIRGNTGIRSRIHCDVLDSSRRRQQVIDRRRMHRVLVRSRSFSRVTRPKTRSCEIPGRLQFFLVSTSIVGDDGELSFSDLHVDVSLRLKNPITHRIAVVVHFSFTDRSNRSQVHSQSKL